MNALFGLKIKVSIGDRTVIGTATATACYLTALPAPNQPKLICSSYWANDPQYLQRHQKKLETRIAENAAYYGLGNPRKSAASLTGKDVGSVSGDLDTLGNIDESEDQGMEADFSAVNQKEIGSDLAYLVECSPDVGSVGLGVGLAFEAVAAAGENHRSTLG